MIYEHLSAVVSGVLLFLVGLPSLQASEDISGAGGLRFVASFYANQNGQCGIEFEVYNNSSSVVEIPYALFHRSNMSLVIVRGSYLSQSVLVEEEFPESIPAGSVDLAPLERHVFDFSFANRFPEIMRVDELELIAYWSFAADLGLGSQRYGGYVLLKEFGPSPQYWCG